jgi:hypothetical protein
MDGEYLEYYLEQYQGCAHRLFITIYVIGGLKQLTTLLGSI